MKKLMGAGIVAALSLVVGFLLGRYTVTGEDPMVMTGMAEVTDGREPLYWVAPMDSSFRRDGPGLSPMGMPLLPVYEESEGDAGAVLVSATVQQNLGLRTATVTRGDLSRELRTVGYTRWNEASLETLHTRTDGWLEAFYLESVGDRIQSGEVIYELFARELVSAQREFLTAQDGDNPRLVAIAQDRLTALGFNGSQIAQLKNTGMVRQRLAYHAERDAVVTAIGTRKGKYVQPGTVIASLASLDDIWIDAEVFESDAGLIENGLPAEITFPAFPGRRWEGRVDYVYPTLDPITRTVRIRLVVANEQELLKPNMFAHVQLRASPRRDVLTVPSEAVIRSQQGSRVIVRDQENRFQPRVVVTGIAGSGLIEVAAGLTEGEVVVTSGQFLLDAEANGEQAFARINQSRNDDESEDRPGGAMAMPTPAEDSGEVTYSTTGTIRSIAGGESITLAHGPVGALNWPAMTMSFGVAPGVVISGFAVDDQVEFVFRALANGSYQIIGITRREARQ